MRIAIGPLPAAWLRKWALDASESLRRASGRGVPMPFAVGDDFFARSQARVGEWLAAAGDGDVFAWEGEEEPDVLLTTLQYWRNLSEVRHDLVVRGEVPAMDVDAERFTQAVQRAMLDGLVAVRRLTPDHAHRLEASWPRLSAAAATTSAAGDRDVAQHERDTSGAAR